MSSLCDLCQYFSILFTEDENLVFRGNSFATKAMDSYMKMIGESVSQAFPFISVSSSVLYRWISQCKE